MNSLPCTRFLLTLVSVIVISAISTDQTNITAQAGQDTFLPCRSPDNKPVIAVEWIRPDLGSDYLLLYRNRKINLENQHVMFKDRVDLQDRQMKDGNLCLVLKNVTTDDRGEYECRIIQTNSWMEIVLTIYLDVLSPPGEPDGGNRDGPAGPSYLVVLLVVGLVALVVIVLALVIVVYWIRKKPSDLSPKSNQSSEEPLQAEQPLTDQNQPAEQ